MRDGAFDVQLLDLDASRHRLVLGCRCRRARVPGLPWSLGEKPAAETGPPAGSSASSAWGWKPPGRGAWVVSVGLRRRAGRFEDAAPSRGIRCGAAPLGMVSGTLGAGAARSSTADGTCTAPPSPFCCFATGSDDVAVRLALLLRLGRTRPACRRSAWRPPRPSARPASHRWCSTRIARQAESSVARRIPPPERQWAESRMSAPVEVPLVSSAAKWTRPQIGRRSKNAVGFSAARRRRGRDRDRASRPASASAPAAARPTAA